jgi:signal transduction histidine kinase
VRRRDAILSLSAAAFVLLALLTVFAIELSNTQAKSKRDVETRVHERGVLAAALIDGLFQSVQQQIPQDAKLYGTRTISAGTLDRHLSQSAFLAVLDPSGRVLASSRGFDAQASADVASSGALALIRSGHPYGLGDLVPYHRSGVLGYAVAFPTRYGVRVLDTGFRPSALGAFLNNDLRKIPGVRGAHNYVLDSRDTVLASTDPARPPGYVFTKPASVAALAHASGDHNGRYYDEVRLGNSTWRIVLAAPNGALFASVSGLRKWVPWAIFAAFALVALVALGLFRRVFGAADAVRDANSRLEQVNGELASTNATLERRAAELARSNGELEQFASIASHDLQEPLRKIRTFTQQLTVIEADNLSDKGRDYLGRANAAAERMQKLIEDLLKFSRVATHGRPFAVVDLSAVAREVLGDLEDQVERSGAAVTVGELPAIGGDALQMRQLIQNLLSNALKFRRPGVVPEVAIEAEIVGPMVQIMVRDNGIGFEPQYSRRIFRVFERLHGRTEYPGTGIGLALCRKIAERHGGTIVADSQPGAGSTFTVTLPLHQAEEAIVLPAPLEHEFEDSREEAHAPA